MPEIAAIILAAGLSKRFKTHNKLFLPFRKTSVIETTIDNIILSKVSKLVLVTNNLTHEQLKKYQSRRITVIENKTPESGMTSSIRKGMEQAGNEDGYMICLGDQPLIETKSYNEIITRFSKIYVDDPKCICVPFFNSKRGNPVIFSSHYRAQILNHKHPEGCKEIITDNPDNVYKLDLNDEGIVTDIDTEMDYKNLSD
jgi:molybdenum cofactor cytidylyltransferase